MSYDALINMVRGNVPMHKIQVSGGMTGGRLKPLEEPQKKNASVDRARKGSGYARKYQLQDQEENEQIEELPAKGSLRRGKAMAAVEDLTSHGTFSEHPGTVPDDLLRVYDNYSFDHVPDKLLLISNYKDTILAQIEANPVLIVKGPTGCGKSTQVPQYILDDARSSQIHCNIVITQPRRITATSVARRVCEERGWNVGTLVGYQIEIEKRTSEDTRLVFCTAGELLQQLISVQSLSTYTHIIIDEVHERDNETDFLLIVIKKLMRVRGNRTKLILMSPTINSDKFVDYFSKTVDNCRIEPPIKELEKETRYHVGQFYLNNLSTLMTIYSVVNNTMAVYLFSDVNSQFTPQFKLSNDPSFNHFLVQRGFAQFMEEPYLSKGFYPTGFTEITLQGPKSPLEMTINSITRKCLGKTAAVDVNSVNSVLLDNNPMDTSSRLVVAGTVSQNYQGDRLTLRNTTIMPSIRGIMGFMCPIFTPKAELSLFQKTRDPLCPTSYLNTYEWNQISEDYLLKPTRSETEGLVYPLIWGVELREASKEAQIDLMKKLLKKLNMYANGSDTMRNAITCELCQVHSTTAVHKNREKRLLGPVEADNARKYRS